MADNQVVAALERYVRVACFRPLSLPHWLITSPVALNKSVKRKNFDHKKTAQVVAKL